MRTLFGMVLLLLVGIVGVGFYQGWFHLSTGSTGDTTSATFTVDQEKIHSDEVKAREKMDEFQAKAKGKTGDQTDTVQEPERRP